MKWELVLPDLDRSWIVHDDGKILVVDKPPFISSQAADPDHPDDLVTRIKRARGGYLGVHQRLDKDTSGLILFVLDPKENARVARAFEKREVKKTYLACVDRWPHGPTKTIARPIDGKKAVTHVRVLERHHGRALLELDLETGRTHQARVHLANAGAPIAGDVEYSGPKAPRLMLHASRLALDGLDVKSDAPPELRAWLEGKPIDGIVEWAAHKRFALTRDPMTTAFRLIHETEIPGLAVDVMDDWLVAHVYEPSALVDLARFGAKGIYVKDRTKGGTNHRLIGEPAPSPLVVKEEGLEYLVRLDGGPAVGLYLDQRRNRTRVRHASQGKRVLNLFAYTCAFTVAAVAGGARASTSVDSSAASLERGHENLSRMDADMKAHQLACEDVATFLARAEKKNERFDIVILDPPSFGRAGSRSFSIDKDFGALARASLSVLAPKGILLACTNHKQTSQNALRKILHDAARAAKVSVGQMKDLALGADFPGDPTMKSVWLRVD